MEVRCIGRSVMETLKKAEDLMKVRHGNIIGVYGWATRARKSLEVETGNR